MTEADLQRAIIDLCKLLGLLWFHDNDPRRNRAGFPDLVIAGSHGCLFRELKTDKGRLRPEQVEWLNTLGDSNQDVGIWRPRDLRDGSIQNQLQGIR